MSCARCVLRKVCPARAAHVSYVQRPVLLTALHVALAGHSTLAPVTGSFRLGAQISAHCVGCPPPTDNAHVGVAVAPSGTSVGHGVDLVHPGEQKPP